MTNNKKSKKKKVKKEIIYRTKEERQKEVKTILDTSGTAFEKGLEAKPLLAKPDLRASENKSFNITIDNQEVAIKIAHRIIDRGAQIALVSYHDTKDIIATSEEVWLAESINREVINIIGTAEAMLAGFAIKLAEEKETEMKEIAKFAMACGLASALTEEEIQRQLNQLDKLFKEIK